MPEKYIGLVKAEFVNAKDNEFNSATVGNVKIALSEKRSHYCCIHM